MSIQFNLPNLETIIQENTTSQSHERGKSYHENGYVYNVINRGNLLQAKVEGSQGDDYQVSIELSPKDVKFATCTCPYDWGGWCKHIVATLYYYQSYPNNIKEKDTLKNLLDRLNNLQIKQLVIKLVNSQPNLIEEVEYQVNRIQPLTINKSSNQSIPQIDTSPICNRVRSIIKEGIRSLEDGWDEIYIDEEIVDIIQDTQEFIDKGDIKNAITILEAITQTCIENWDDAEDYGIEPDYVAEILDQFFAEAILSKELDQSDKVNLQDNLEFWQNEWSENFNVTLLALKEGWNDPDLQQKLQGKVTNLEVFNDNNINITNYNLISIRLKILQKQERYEEYLSLAKVEGETEEYLSCLISLGKINRAIDEAYTLITKMEEAYYFAKQIKEQGEFERALKIACFGFSKEGNYQEKLAHWTAELAQELGEEEIELMALLKAFNAQPSLKDYQKIKQLAQEDWLSLKEDLLDDLRSQQGWSIDTEKVKIFLQEKLIDDVIKMVDNDYYLLSTSILEEVIPFNPDWVIKKAIPQAESIMNEGKSKYYSKAVNWLEKAKKAYEQKNNSQEWKEYYQELMKIHSRKRKLVGLLKTLI